MINKGTSKQNKKGIDMNKQLTSYDILIKTVKDLSTSQGYYSRLNQMINEMTINERLEFKKKINSECNFKDSTDVILYIEG